MTKVEGYVPTEEDYNRIKFGLNRFNVHQHAPLQDEALKAFKVLDDDGDILGEAVVELFCGSLEIKLLYVEDGHKGRGIGSQLMQAIESCDYGVPLRSIFVWTTSWQAPGFYERCGYERKTSVLLNTDGHFNNEPQYDILYYKEYK